MKKSFIILISIAILALISSCTSISDQYKVLSRKDVQQLSNTDLIWLVDYCNQKANKAFSSFSGTYWAQQAQVYQQEELLRLVEP